ncbi:MAG: hypothetical protein N4A33_06190 [Bacteriovoracaceae bacterium]|jgi:hypothetical protein|nr:hypothetical protein [Bacteriovoracaceae bacterium]
MEKIDVGRQLYKSTALMPIKVFFLTICTVLFVNLYFQTYIDPDFIKWHRSGLKAVVDFHFFYPEQILSLILSTLIPTLYYSFYRGISFHENGMIVNRGLPYLNHMVPYNDIESYKIVHHKYLVSIKRKSNDEDLLFSIQDIDRAVAIFDQHDIKGDLSKAGFDGVTTTSKRLVMFYIVFAIVVTILQFSGFFIWVNQILFR